MKTNISSKLIAMLVALTLNTLIIAGVAVLFDLRLQNNAPAHQTNLTLPNAHAVA